MTITYSTQNIQSNVLAYESLESYGFCRKQVNVDNTSGTMKLGSALYRTVDRSATLTVYGAWTEITATHLGNAATTFAGEVEVAVIIGTGKVGEALHTSQVDIEADSSAPVVLLVRGAAMLRKNYLVYQGAQSSGALANLVDLIELTMEQVICVDSATAFTGTYSDVTAIS